MSLSANFEACLIQGVGHTTKNGLFVQLVTLGHDFFSTSCKSCDLLQDSKKTFGALFSFRWEWNQMRLTPIYSWLRIVHAK